MHGGCKKRLCLSSGSCPRAHLYEDTALGHPGWEKQPMPGGLRYKKPRLKDGTLSSTSLSTDFDSSAFLMLSISFLLLFVAGIFAIRAAGYPSKSKHGFTAVYPGRAASPGKSKYGFIPPTSTDLRGPCPALNALANHGYLPRNGKNVTIRGVLQASYDVYNIDPAVLIGVAKLGLLTSAEPDSFTLDDIKLHGTIEFDASLSRADFAIGDNSRFNETIFTTLANSNPGVEYYNVTSAGQVQFERLAESERTNPNITNTDKEIGFRSFTSALYLAVFGNVTTGIAPKNFVQIWFREDRLPFAEGWERPACTLDGASVTALTGAVQAASNWTTSGGCPYVRTGASAAPTLDSQAICKQLESVISLTAGS
ncbi:Peroxidase, family 2-domain-containing protein [Mycena crocata]|nr:Peroxidase, family 2-domain-containing protein [Mycena crocata]